MGLFVWPIIKMFSNFEHSTFTQVYRSEEDNIGQSIWDKVRYYWEHIQEHIGNLENSLGTWREHLGNPKSPPKLQHPRPPLPPPFLTFMKHLVVIFSKTIVWCNIGSYSMYTTPSVDHFFGVIRISFFIFKIIFIM